MKLGLGQSLINYRKQVGDITPNQISDLEFWIDGSDTTTINGGVVEMMTQFSSGMTNREMTIMSFKTHLFHNHCGNNRGLVPIQNHMFKWMESMIS